MERKNVWKEYTKEQLDQVEAMAVRYKTCLDLGKTERECVKISIDMAKERGYVDLNECIAQGKTLKAGDKVYASWMGKAVAFFHIGERPLEEGMNILGAHIDSPRIDLKQNPLYEDSELAFLDTHYYGGIKKYHWVAMPLALHGVVAKKDGTVQEVVIGEREEDPVLVITDLLIHLSQEQMEKKASVVIEGENLDVLVGSRPLTGEEKKEGEEVKEAILKFLKDTYDIEEEDFLSAELELVPAGKARDCGLDRSMVMGYGQDDRVCAFTSLFAMLEADALKRTGCCLLVDKEEIGSMGASGMQSRFFEDMVEEVALLTGNGNTVAARRTLRNSFMLSSDVSAAFDPLYASAFEKKNTAFFGKGMVLNKYTGVRGKAGSSDANAEYIAKIRKVFADRQIAFQTAELGRVDLGGGGTIAYIMANYGMNVIDSGVAVLAMHAPYEISSKADIYETCRGYKAFLEEME
ncbi:aminopeptidase [Suipraeoptans intestinalis]|uniref:M18 family aminopeptidase n=1 Tax=Suipraeoptans intestinalis TaxID=2606628 RepID=A0A6N7UTG0_9FIRM|nr:aminopeptidase [Suipraeoptans intestinalis]MDD7769569.1 aminopeptidase [Suipraeoptans intestinalis]MDY3122633.1 aminopeptidase [Suipraeoptans intestinalis]MSR94751.1 aminopeptidase [Suipraeoptans intestinalis]